MKGFSDSKARALGSPEDQALTLAEQSVQDTQVNHELPRSVARAPLDCEEFGEQVLHLLHHVFLRTHPNPQIQNHSADRQRSPSVNSHTPPISIAHPGAAGVALIDFSKAERTSCAQSTPTRRSTRLRQSCESRSSLSVHTLIVVGASRGTMTCHGVQHKRFTHTRCIVKKKRTCSRPPSTHTPHTHTLQSCLDVFVWLTLLDLQAIHCSFLKTYD